MIRKYPIKTKIRNPSPTKKLIHPDSFRKILFIPSATKVRAKRLGKIRAK